MATVDLGVPGFVKVGLSEQDVEKLLRLLKGSRKPIKHYLLMAPEWKGDLFNALEYILKFQPCCGFSLSEAMQAEFVTIAGSCSGIDKNQEEILKKAGCKVERLNGITGEDTKALFDERARGDKACFGGEFKRGY